MALDIASFVKTRPFAYHLTSRSNLESIARCGRIHSTAELIRMSGQPELLRRRRVEHVVITAGGCYVSLRDQAPLRHRNLELRGGWSFDDFVEALNSRVFFWPGTQHGPSDYGRRHFDRYKAERPAIIRVKTRELLDANVHSAPEFCRLNSGSPRYSYGQPSPRGPETFVAALLFVGAASSVVELTFPTLVQLPDSWEVGLAPDGPWVHKGFPVR